MVEQFVACSLLVLCSLSLAAADTDTYSNNTASYSSGRELSYSDNMVEPEWLQDVPLESKVAKYRKRRFLAFPPGSKLTVSVDCIVMFLLKNETFVAIISCVALSAL